MIVLLYAESIRLMPLCCSIQSKHRPLDKKCLNEHDGLTIAHNKDPKPHQDVLQSNSSRQTCCSSLGFCVTPFGREALNGHGSMSIGYITELHLRCLNETE